MLSMKNISLKCLLMLSLLALCGLRGSSAMAEDAAAFLATMDNASATLRYPAWTTAEKYGPSVIVPLGEKMEAADRSKSQDLKRAIERIVHQAGQPGADAERKAVAAELVKLLVPDRSAKVKNEILDLLGYIADESNLSTIEPLLADEAVRVEACRAIQRIPGRAATACLEQSLEKSQGDFTIALLGALGQRKDKSAGPALEKFMNQSKGDLKLLSLEALAKSGALPPRELRKIFESIGKPIDPDVRANIRLMFADNLAAQGETERARKIYESLLKAKDGDQIPIAAQKGLDSLSKK